MHSLEIDDELLKKLDRLSKKNKKQVEIIMKKADEILKDPRRYKNVRVPLNMLKRVHIDKHFVLTFSVDDNKRTVTLEDYDRHDNICK